MSIKDTISKEDLLFLYRNFSDIEISKRLNISERSVCRLRRHFKIPTKNCYRFTRNPLRHQVLTPYQERVLFGTLLGDSAIGKQSSGTGFWICTHSTAQKKYLIKKAGILNPFTSKIFEGYRSFEKGGPEFPYIRARSFSLPQFTYYRELFYPNGFKILTPEIFKRITPTGLSYWWMDDGCKGRYSFNIVTYDKFFKENTEEALRIFKDRLNLDVSITWDEKEGNICILRKSHELLWYYIKPEISVDLIYKLPLKYQ